MNLLKSAYLQWTDSIYFRVPPDSHSGLERWQGFIPHLAIEIGLYLPPFLQNQTDTEDDIRTYCVFKPITHCQKILTVLWMVGVLTSQATSFLYSFMLGVTEGRKCTASLSVSSDTLGEEPHTRIGDASLPFQQQYLILSLITDFRPFLVFHQSHRCIHLDTLWMFLVSIRSYIQSPFNFVSQSNYSQNFPHRNWTPISNTHILPLPTEPLHETAATSSKKERNQHTKKPQVTLQS